MNTQEPKGNGTTTCKFCGSENLWDAYWNRQGLATTQPGPKDRYRTRCTDCNRYQSK